MHTLLHYTDMIFYSIELDPELAMKTFKKQFAGLLRLMSIGSNRLSIVAEIFSEDLIPWEFVADSSNRSDQEKSISLLSALMTTISSQPESLLKIIEALKRVETFRQIADKLSDDLYL